MKWAFFHQYLEKLFTLLNSSPHVRVFRILQLYHPRVYLPRHLFQQEKFKSIQDHVERVYLRDPLSACQNMADRCPLCRYQLSVNLDPDGQRCLTVHSIVRRESSLKPFMASIRVRTSVSSPASSSFISCSHKLLCII